MTRSGNPHLCSAYVKTILHSRPLPLLNGWTVTKSYIKSVASCTGCVLPSASFLLNLSARASQLGRMSSGAAKSKRPAKAGSSRRPVVQPSPASAPVPYAPAIIISCTSIRPCTVNSSSSSKRRRARTHCHTIFFHSSAGCGLPSTPPSTWKACAIPSGSAAPLDSAAKMASNVPPFDSGSTAFSSWPMICMTVPTKRSCPYPDSLASSKLAVGVSCMKRSILSAISFVSALSHLGASVVEGLDHA
mmetsp:Transcript_45120/g.108280  ORF Transcript_45120/g.108280 Transcript_45120/m.108280 type:complete len:246 (+) Transcript_45120:287-1024(+)